MKVSRNLIRISNAVDANALSCLPLLSIAVATPPSLETHSRSLTSSHELLARYFNYAYS